MLKLVGSSKYKKEKIEATEEFIRLLNLAMEYLDEAQKLQKKYNIKIPQ
jgi:hypothetical protein